MSLSSGHIPGLYPLSLLLAPLVSAVTVRPSAPVMGWNSYNFYNCKPTEAIIKSNTDGLVALGLDKLGYTLVTVDCGWNAPMRDGFSRELFWDPDTFPSGAGALGEYIHAKGLKFGLYSGAGYFQCGSTNEPASLGFEKIDAESFAKWGGDALKYDNCYAKDRNTQVSFGEESASPERHREMARELDAQPRKFMYQVCQWGVGTNVGEWASEIATSWRVSNDIAKDWQSIWRITNQVVPYWRHVKVGAYPDMDMLIVGLKALSLEEERFHFGMWVINKSPLIIGAPTDKSITPPESLAVLSNKEVIAINQDPLGQQARLIRRYTVAGWDLWGGDLSSGRMVVGLANWKTSSVTVQFDFGSVLAVASANARDIWAGKDIGKVEGVYSTTLNGHELKLLVLSDIVRDFSALPKSKVGNYYNASDATLELQARRESCPEKKCSPVGVKVAGLGKGPAAAAVTFKNMKAAQAGTVVLGVDYINYDVALPMASGSGDNTRNMSITVNGGEAQHWAFPISGGDWYETGRLTVEVQGFKHGVNEVVFRAATEDAYAPDLVGVEILE